MVLCLLVDGNIFFCKVLSLVPIKTHFPNLQRLVQFFPMLHLFFFLFEKIYSLVPERVFTLFFPKKQMCFSRKLGCPETTYPVVLIIISSVFVLLQSLSTYSVFKNLRILLDFLKQL